MGDPVELSDAERSRIRKLARSIVQSVVDDDLMPHELEIESIGKRRMFDADDVESLVTQLCQEICKLVDEKQAFCRAFQVVDVTTAKDSE
jgi:hypothetical protein